MAPHSSTPAWKIPWMEELGRLQSMGSLKVRHDGATSLSLFTFMHWRRKRQPTPVFLPGESQGRGSLVGCHLWGHTESDMTEVTQQWQLATQCVVLGSQQHQHHLGACQMQNPGSVSDSQSQNLQVNKIPGDCYAQNVEKYHRTHHHPIKALLKIHLHAVFCYRNLHYPRKGYIFNTLSSIFFFVKCTAQRLTLRTGG